MSWLSGHCGRTRSATQASAPAPPQARRTRRRATAPWRDRAGERRGTPGTRRQSTSVSIRRTVRRAPRQRELHTAISSHVVSAIYRMRDDLFRRVAHRPVPVLRHAVNDLVTVVAGTTLHPSTVDPLIPASSATPPLCAAACARDRRRAGSGDPDRSLDPTLETLHRRSNP
jgi:hypothetical protein